MAPIVLIEFCRNRLTNVLKGDTVPKSRKSIKVIVSGGMMWEKHVLTFNERRDKSDQS